MSDYSREQIYDAMRRADAAGDGEAVKALAAALKGGASKDQIVKQAADSGLTVDEAALDANIASRDAGGQTSEFLPPKPATIGDGVQNALAGAAQGAAGGIYDFPQQIAQAPTYAMNALTRGVASGLDAVGLDGPANFLARGANRYDADLGNMPTVSGLIEQLSPTPKGMEGARLAAQFIGGAAVPFGPKVAPRPVAPRTTVAPKRPAASDAAELVNTGQREGVRVMTSDVKPPRTFTGRIARAAGERIPYAGTGGPRVKQNEERIEAVKRLASDFGVDASEEVLDKVTDDLAKTRGSKIAALTKRKDQVIDGIQGNVATPGAVAEIDRQIAKLSRLEADEVGPVIGKLQNWRDALLGKTARIDTGILDADGKPIIREIPPERSLRVIDDLRKLMGEAFNDPGLAAVKGIGQKAVNKIYAPLRDDMGNFIRSNGGDEAFGAWKGSNDELAAMAGELDAKAFKGVLNDAETTPENVAKLLFSKKPSDVRRLYANLSPAGQEKAKAAMLHEAIRRAGGIDEVSPQKFANVLKDQGKAVGIIFGNDAPRIEGIVRLLRATQQASVASAAPPTGVQATQFVGGGALTAWLGPMGAAGAVGLAGAAARLYESAPVRNLLVGLSRSKPGSPQERTMIARIEKVLASQEGISPAMNDNVRTVTSAAASDGAEAQPNQ